MKRTIGIAVAAALSCSTIALAQTTAPVASQNAPQNSPIKEPHATKSGAPAAGHNSFTKGQAKRHIEKAGYSNVTGLVKDKDGLWQGHAEKNGQQVNVAMDFQGNVTSK